MIRTTDTSRDSDARYYFDEAAPEVKYPGVTGIIDMKSKPFLQGWYANMAADLALDSLDYVGRMAERDREGAKKFVAGAAKRYSRARSDVGSKAHDLFERMIRGEHVRRVHPDVVGHQAQFADFLDVVQPQLVLAEEVAWSDTHRYAGSPDAVLRYRADEKGRPDPAGEFRTVIADWKTGKNTYPEVALQLSAYANADWIVSPDDAKQNPAELGITGGVVLHITDEQWALKPVEIGPEVFAAFLHLRAVFDWDRELSRTVLGKPVASSKRSALTGTERRG